jgi:hypothetical protein
MALTTWREWPIPLSDLAGKGVDVTAVKKMSIGVGTPGGSTPGGTGMLFIDDIWVKKP